MRIINLIRDKRPNEGPTLKFNEKLYRQSLNKTMAYTSRNLGNLRPSKTNSVFSLEIKLLPENPHRGLRLYYFPKVEGTQAR